MSKLTNTSNMTFPKTHPWLKFAINLQSAPPAFWMMLGECQSKCFHLSSIPLFPSVQQHLLRVYLAKGVAATVAIEGNTLSENQVLEQIEGRLTVPPSQQYLAKETENILNGCNMLLAEIEGSKHAPISVPRIKQLNKIILDGLELADGDTIPGEIRHHQVGVGSYRAAPADECEYLMERLCAWLDSNEFSAKSGLEITYAILKAIVAHLYIAWIHPFGDGNGRTARLLEVQILLSSGVPAPAAQLLSNHYNATRSEYYRQLELSQKDTLSFLSYAVEGLRDGLREQIEMVQMQQLETAWINYVHERFESLKGVPHNRRKHLVLDLSAAREPVPLNKLRSISARVAVAYKDRTYQTLFRDLRELVNMDLITRESKGFRAKKEVMRAFFPVKANLAKKPVRNVTEGV